MVDGNTAQFRAVRLPFNLLRADGIIGFIKVYTTRKRFYIGVVSSQNEEYLLQPVPGGGECISVVPRISIDADVAEDIQRIIYPLSDRNFVAFKDCAGYWRECLLAVNAPISLNMVARPSELFDMF